MSLIAIICFLKCLKLRWVVMLQRETGKLTVCSEFLIGQLDTTFRWAVIRSPTGPTQDLVYAGQSNTT